MCQEYQVTMDLYNPELKNILTYSSVGEEQKDIDAMSFYPALRKGRSSDKPKSKRYPKLLITHGDDIANLSKQQLRGKVPVLKAQQLCVDLKGVITTIFKENKVCQNAIKFLSWQPAITCSIETNFSNDNQVSGNYPTKGRRE